MSDAQVGSATLGARTNGAQRRFARANVRIAARLDIGTASTNAEATIRNLGGGGLRLATTEEIAREEVVTVRFSLPTVDHEIMVRGKVVLSFFDAAESRFLHGVAFTQIVRGDQAGIVSYVESIDHEASDGS